MKRLAITAALSLAGCANLGVQTPLSAEAPTFRHYAAVPVGYEAQKYRLAKVLQDSYEGCLPADKVSAVAPPACDADKLETSLGQG